MLEGFSIRGVGEGNTQLLNSALTVVGRKAAGAIGMPGQRWLSWEDLPKEHVDGTRMQKGS